ncbi:hypothetical protein AK812_SmicGene42387 [Symbiodinium microadriaticum]|uniref:Uncharacterized protein n=1 Tax=Symbiodinium microadriaticum TaxID=2951 RepID=A0A1Q9C3P4_SYMMI|nr:hypothetical protein AK812_SmicGene42387 [Symbiodinium microadriaticum]
MENGYRKWGKLPCECLVGMYFNERELKCTVVERDMDDFAMFVAKFLKDFTDVSYVCKVRGLALRLQDVADMHKVRQHPVERLGQQSLLKLLSRAQLVEGELEVPAMMSTLETGKLRSQAGDQLSLLPKRCDRRLLLLRRRGDH